MTPAAFIIGGGGHAKDIHAWTHLPMLPHHEQALHRTPGRMVIGINDPKTRFDVAATLGRAKWEATPPLIHRTAWFGLYCELGDGVVVGPQAVLGTEVRLEQHVHVGALAHLTRCQVGEFTTIGPGATVCGDVMIGAHCLIGAGATIKNLVRIGRGVTVGAGAVVVCDIPDGLTVKGVPARP